MKPPLYLFGVPGEVGGAATKVAHLLALLRDSFAITVVVPDAGLLKDKGVVRYTASNNITVRPRKELPKRIEGTALAVCELTFFSAGIAQTAREKGLKLVWSNEMMFPFKGEAEAVREGLVDRVLFVSEFQAKAFEEMYRGVPSYITGNYIDPDDYAFKERRNGVFTIGRLSRPDPQKYPLDFPVFYEELGFREARYRVMAWSPEVQKQYRWHRFGPEWELLPANREAALKFLYSLDLFVYPLGHRIKESWGRAVVEAMLTGCVPLVPAGHQFHKLMVHGESGFICGKFSEWKEAARELHGNYELRQRMARAASDYAREELCNPEEHRKRWVEALTF
jgi:glycosyltransferase involved in cell wall biosynthesis